MSLETMIPTDIAAKGRIAASTLAYLAERAQSNCYDYVMRKFQSSGISKAELARRTGKGPDGINKTLANPANWTIRTIAELLAGIAEEEFIPDSLPLAGRLPRNLTQADLIAGLDTKTILPTPPVVTGSSVRLAFVKSREPEVVL
jgi:lambda repressor-like predicted transcriptional regulator